MNEDINYTKIMNNSKTVFNENILCDYCFGRLFSKIDNNKTNKEIGKKLRKINKISSANKPDICSLCSGLSTNKNIFIKIIIDKLKNYEFNNFLLGTIVDEEILKREEIFLSKYKLDYFESIKNEFNREIGIILENKLSKNVDFNNPEIMIIIDTQFYLISLQIKSLYIYGHYKKYKRGIPQTKWFCRTCKGIGCKLCGYSGKIYEESVEDLIADSAIKMTKGDKASFHGAGREDIDVKMLGNGRPFILEVFNPINRNIDLDILQNSINNINKNKISVSELKFVSKNEIKKIKTKKYKKTYRVVIYCKKQINIEKLKKAALSLQGKIISQYTPTRVARRRANMIRNRKIYELDIESYNKNYATLIIKSESGTYIKELITGDNGKTKPNINDLIGNQCEVDKLDVINIKE